MKSEKPNKYHRFDLNARVTIQQGLNNGMKVSDIAKQLDVSPSSVKREIERNREYIESSGNDCIDRKKCQERNACKKKCNHYLCKHCKTFDCYDGEHCTNYIKGYCERLISKAPHVCNGCKSIQSCTYEKYVYKAGIANKNAHQAQQDKICPFHASDEKIKQIDELISPLIKNGMSPEVALSSVQSVVGISLSTLYRMIDASMLTARNCDLPEKVGRRKRRPPKKPMNKDVYTVLKEEKKGRTYQDYLDFISSHNVFTVQMDCVEGRKTDPEAILSLHWVESHMQLYFLLPIHDAANVVEMLDIIEGRIGLNVFRVCLPLILTDNGEEFSNIEDMEQSYTVPGERRTRIFFCEPNRSDQKAECECNHKLLRRIIPKRTSYDDPRNMSIHGLKQYHMTLISNHINSYARPDMNYLRPYDMARGVLPEEFFDNLGLETIPITDIILKPSLIYHK